MDFPSILTYPLGEVVVEDVALAVDVWHGVVGL